MKKIFITLITLLIFSTSAQAFDLKGALKNLGGTGDNDKNSTAGAIAGALGNLLSTDKIELSTLTGTWNYQAPAVTFKSDNLLKKAGGAAVSSTITGKLEPVYKMVGFDKMQMTVNADSTFTMKVRGISLKGSISSDVKGDSQANFVFSFKVAGKINLGKMDTYITKSATGNICIMFDITKLVALLEKVSSVANIKALKTATDLLKGYDGLCAGFELKKAN